MSLKLSFAALTDVGVERAENQDAYGSAHLDGLDVYIVCDGMGGHAGGSTASRLGVETIEKQLAASSGDVPTRVASAIEIANTTIQALAREQRELYGMGTTVVALAVEHETNRAFVAHVGDSRIYRLRGREMRRLTRDHTMVQRLVDDGILTPEAAENHPNSNVISRSLGGRPTVDVELGPEPLDLREGDLFILCSDGLHGLVSEAEIARVASSMAPDEAVRTLVQMANDAGGHDNITVEIVRVGAAADAVEDVDIVHPPPAPGSRLAIAAELAASGAHDATPTPTAAGIPAPGTPLDELSEPDEHRRMAGGPAIVIAAIVLAVIAIVLIALGRG